MNYAFSALIDKIKEEGGIGLLDAMWKTTNYQAIENAVWGAIGEEKMPQPWKYFLANVQSFDESTAAGEAEKKKFLEVAPREVQKPVWTRWGTVSLMLFCI